MWFFRRKKIHNMHVQKEQEAEAIKAETARRTDKATEPIEKLTRRYERNGITMIIKAGVGGRHV